MSLSSAVVKGAPEVARRSRSRACIALAIDSRSPHAATMMSVAFQSIAPGNRFEFYPDGFLDVDHGSRLEFKSREG